MPAQTKLLITIIIMSIASMSCSHIGHDAYYILKPLTSILVIALAWRLGERPINKYFKLTMAALVFCLIGDSLLLFPHLFIGGLIAFLIGHILFAISFVARGGFSRNVGILIPLLLYGAAFYYYIYDHLGALSIPVAIYIAFIMLMAWQGIALYYKQKSTATLCIAIGVVLFLISDSILAYNKFVSPVGYSSYWILSTYWGAIVLLAYGTHSHPTRH